MSTTLDVDEAIGADSTYINADMAPVPMSARKWGTRDIAALWVSMSACIPTYMLASSLISEGMNWWQAVLTIALGNTIVLVPMILNAHAGTKYGIPFPVYCRASFGLRGANVPAMLRALVACGWFGIQTWIGGAAIYKILGIYFPAWQGSPRVGGLGINAAELACFLGFWAINMAVIYRGIDSIRFLLNIKAPLLIALGLILLGWAYHAAGGFGPMFAQPSAFDPGQPKAGKFWPFFFPALTGMIGFWATLSLNIPDFSRYAHSQRDQALGQAIGLPTTMALYSFIGVAVTSATVVIYGETIWDPVDVLARFRNPFVLTLAMLALCLATLATNLAANVVGPANDFAHLWPRRISFRTGGLITGILGIVIQPWRLLADPSGYIFKWLVAYSSLLGAIGGILIADYFLLRRTRLDLPGLYRKDGPYWYSGGFNPAAIIALVLGIAPSVPGFIGTVTSIEVPAAWIGLYSYAWFVGFGVSFAVYAGLMIGRDRAGAGLGLRLAILAVVLGGVAIGGMARVAQGQRGAVAAIRGAGGMAFHEPEWTRFELDGLGRLEVVKSGGDSPWPAWLLDRLGPDFFHPVKIVVLDKKAGKSAMAELGRLGDIEELRVKGPDLTDAEFRHVGGLDRLRHLSLEETGVTGAGLANVSGLVGLRWLELPGMAVSDADLAHLAGLKDLELLTLSGLGITDAGLAHLRGLAKLKHLRLFRTRVGPAGLEALGGLTRLTNLDLSGTLVADLAPLRRADRLRTLYLGNAPVDDAGLAAVGGLRSLEYLSLSDTKVGDAGLAHLAGLDRLKTLDLNRTGITDAGWPALAGLPALTTVYSFGTATTAGAKDRFLAAHPGAQVGR